MMSERDRPANETEEIEVTDRMASAGAAVLSESDLLTEELYNVATKIYRAMRVAYVKEDPHTLFSD